MDLFDHAKKPRRVLACRIIELLAKLNDPEVETNETTLDLYRNLLIRPQSDLEEAVKTLEEQVAAKPRRTKEMLLASSPLMQRMEESRTKARFERSE